MSDRKAVIKNADMSEEMQQEAVDCATTALEKVIGFKLLNFSLHKLWIFINYSTVLNRLVAKLTTMNENSMLFYFLAWFSLTI